MQRIRLNALRGGHRLTRLLAYLRLPRLDRDGILQPRLQGREAFLDPKVLLQDVLPQKSDTLLQFLLVLAQLLHHGRQGSPREVGQ